MMLVKSIKDQSIYSTLQAAEARPPLAQTLLSAVAVSGVTVLFILEIVHLKVKF